MVVEVVAASLYFYNTLPRLPCWGELAGEVGILAALGRLACSGYSSPGYRNQSPSIKIACAPSLDCDTGTCCINRMRALGNPFKEIRDVLSTYT